MFDSHVPTMISRIRLLNSHSSKTAVLRQIFTSNRIITNNISVSSRILRIPDFLRQMPETHRQGRNLRDNIFGPNQTPIRDTCLFEEVADVNTRLVVQDARASEVDEFRDGGVDASDERVRSEKCCGRAEGVTLNLDDGLVHFVLGQKLGNVKSHIWLENIPNVLESFVDQTFRNARGAALQWNALEVKVKEPLDAASSPESDNDLITLGGVANVAMSEIFHVIEDGDVGEGFAVDAFDVLADGAGEAIRDLFGDAGVEFAEVPTAGCFCFVVVGCLGFGEGCDDDDDSDDKNKNRGEESFLGH